MRFEIPQALVEQVLNYLAQKPYIETFKLISDLQSLAKIPGTDVAQAQTSPESIPEQTVDGDEAQNG